MAFDLKIKNIGKLADAEIRIGQFTVFAGPNNTGKSFVSKVLYSLFDAMNVNLAEIQIKNLTNPIIENMAALDANYDDVENELFQLLDATTKLQNLVIDSPAGDFDALGESMPRIVDMTNEMVNLMEGDLLDFLEFMAQGHDAAQYNIDDLQRSLIDLRNEVADITAEEFIASGLAYKIRENLINNFQVAKLSDIRGSEESPSSIDIGELIKLQFDNGRIKSDIKKLGLKKMQQYSKVVYLESPVYWKLKNALEILRISPRYGWKTRSLIDGVPGYFYDLASDLKGERTGEIAFPNLYARLTGDDVIGGKITISKSGDLSFQENGRNFSLPVTAMGIGNLGILALLVERKIIDKESFVFIDEPEAHLHPAWQVVMAESLFELAKGGVNVVIATHSADILKWLEVHIKKNPDDESLVALNKFPCDGGETDEQDFRDKIAAIKQELTKPFADLYTAGL